MLKRAALISGLLLFLAEDLAFAQRECQTPDDDPNTVVRCVPDTTYPTVTCTFTCKEGYHFENKTDTEIKHTCDMQFAIWYSGPHTPPCVPDEPAESQDSHGHAYLLLTPTSIRPGMKFSLSVHIIRATADVLVTASVMRVGTATPVATANMVFSSGTAGNLTMQIPYDLERESSRYELNVTGQGGLTFTNDRTLTLSNKYMSVFVQTDRAIYNPGQTVNFRTLTLFSDMKVYTGPMTVSILDPKGNTMKLWPNVTGENGVFNQSLSLSTKPVQGDWIIHVEAENEQTGKTFTVAEYVLPRFEVKVEAPFFALQTDTTIPITVTAKYTFGKPVKGEVVIKPKLINDYYDYYYSRDCFVLVERLAELNDQGQVKIEFPVSHLTQLMCGYTHSLIGDSFTFDVNVTETETGITQNGSATVKFFRERARMEFLPISPKTFKPGLDYVAYVKISEPDGLPLTSWAGEILTVTTTLDSWDIMCNYRYGNVQYDLDPKTFVIPADGLVTVKQPNVPENVLKITMVASYKGMTARLHVGKSYSPSNNYIQVTANSSADCEPGQLATFQVKATEPVGTLVYVVLSRGTVVSSGSATQGSSSTEYTLAIPCLPSMAPEARVLIYYLRDDGEIVSDTSTIHSNNAFENQVSITMDRQEAEPGESVQLQISATPLSTAYLLAVDQSSLLLKSGNDITADQVFHKLEALGAVTGQTSQQASWNTVLTNAGVALLTDGLTCVDVWSSWINMDNPDKGDGDYEQLPPSQWSQICPDGHVDGIQCVTTEGMSYENSGEVVSCTLHEGLRCVNRDNFPYPCSDYSVRYRCKTCTQAEYPDAQQADLQAADEKQTGSCIDKADIVFVVDDSSSITYSDFNTLKTWILDLLNSFTVAPDRVRVGLETFATHVKAEFHLNNFTSDSDIAGSVRNQITHHGGGTNTGGALEFLRTTMFTEENGDRAGVPNVAIVITDGQSTFPNYTANQAQLARDDNITLIVLGIGSGVSRSEIEAIVTAPASENAFHVSNYHLLSSVLTGVLASLCKAGGRKPAASLNCITTTDVDWYGPSTTTRFPPPYVNPTRTLGLTPYPPSWVGETTTLFTEHAATTTYLGYYGEIPTAYPPGYTGQTPTAHPRGYTGQTPTVFPAGYTGEAPTAFPPGYSAGYSTDFAEVERVRVKFPETWLWTSAPVGTNGTAMVTSTVPDTITSWVTSAFAVSSSTGFGVTSQATKLRVFRPFFVTLTLPYSVIRGEQVVIQAVVFNYMNTDQHVRVTMAQSQDFYNLEIDSSGQEQLTRHDKAITVDIPAGESKSVHFPIVPVSLGHVELAISAQSHDAADGIRRNLLVKAEGIPMEVNYGMVVDLTNSSTFTRDVPLPLPNNTVTGSERIRVSAIGDLMGPTLAGLDSLLQMPSGCGEQTMIGLAPDVFVLDYLDATNQLTDDIRQRAVHFIESGYQRELDYQHRDGSYSIWGNSDPAGSMWLTAFVAKTFHQARSYVTIDDNVILKALNWILYRQNSDGSFPEYARVHDSSLRGGATADRLTAFVLITLLENKDTSKARWHFSLNAAVEKAVMYLIRHTPAQDDNYGLAITAYALTLAHDPHGSTLLSMLERNAVVDGEYRYWTDRRSSSTSSSYYSPYYYTAHDIEVTSYALLTYAATHDYVGGRSVMNWLASQRNAHGGYRSTQDTVVALQALSRFAPMAQNTNGLNVDVRAKAPSFNPHFSVTDSNAIVLQTAEKEFIPDNLTITATGSGVALVQVDLFFNVEEEVEKPTFEITVNILKDDIKKLELETCAKWLASGYSGMAVIEVGVPSGFEADLDTVTGPDTLRQTELEDTKVILYFDVIGRTESCVRMTVQRTRMVAKSKPSAVRVYDYYSPENQAKAFYQSAVLRDSNACDVCPECQCPSTSRK